MTRGGRVRGSVTDARQAQTTDNNHVLHNVLSNNVNVTQTHTHTVFGILLGRHNVTDYCGSVVWLVVTSCLGLLLEIPAADTWPALHLQRTIHTFRHKHTYTYAPANLATHCLSWWEYKEDAELVTERWWDSVTLCVHSQQPLSGFKDSQETVFEILSLAPFTFAYFLDSRAQCNRQEVDNKICKQI